MPVSSPLGKNIIKDWFDRQTDISSIVDVGAGAGTYRDLLGGKYHWTAVEIWEDYINKYNLKSRYENVVYGDIAKIELPDADCIIFGDIIEHLKFYEGRDVLVRAIKKYKHVVLSIPLGVYQQGAIEGNPYEEHQSTWELALIPQFSDWEIIHIEAVNPKLPGVMQMAVFIK